MRHPYTRSVLLVAALIIGFAPLTACTSNPGLSAYRSTLHKVDESIYEDYLAYVDEAERKGTRTPDTIATNRRIVEQARRIYETGGELATSTTKPAGGT